MTYPRWHRAIVVLLAGGLWLGGCSRSRESEEPDRPVAEAPATSEERPAWAEGPVDESVQRSKSDGSEARRGPSRREGPQRRSGPPPLEEWFPDEQITLDFRQTRIRRVLRIFQAKARTNIVIDESVDGKITVRTEAVPIADAFRAVLRAADLAYETTGGSVVLRPK